MIRFTQKTDVQQGVEVTHVILPVCLCGHPHGDHHAGHECTTKCGCACYRASRQVDELTSNYVPWSRTTGWRRWACLRLWDTERWARSTRQRIEKRL